MLERAVEALLFASAEPLSLDDLRARLPADVPLNAVIDGLIQRYAGRGVELVCVAGRYQFQTAADLAYLLRAPDAAPQRLSRAALETLAVIAYHQPVTRAEIEAIRGVGLSRGTLDHLLELGWVRMRGRRRAPGRPITFGTTPAFLMQFSLGDLSDLPGAADMKAAGLLSLDLPADFQIPNPSHVSAEPEDPLEPTDAESPEFHQDFLGEPET